MTAGPSEGTQVVKVVRGSGGSKEPGHWNSSDYILKCVFLKKTRHTYTYV